MRSDISGVLSTDRVGFVEHMPFEEYKAVPAVNMSTACHMADSPLHALSAWHTGIKDTDSLQWGRATHIAAFEPLTFEDRVWQAEGRRTAKLKQEAKDAGAELLKPGDVQFSYESAVQAAYRLSKLDELQPFIKSGQAELSGFVVEEGMQCKFRLDWLRTGDPCIIDLKTTRCAASFAFSRDFFRLAYDAKLGFYQAASARLLGAKPSDIPVYLLIVENTIPHDCFLAPRYGGEAIPIDQAVLDRGVIKALGWIKRIRECIDSGEWPGRTASPNWILEVPSWEMEEDEFINDS